MSKDHSLSTHLWPVLEETEVEAVGEENLKNKLEIAEKNSDRKIRN
jgi:hypothetical protein